jgi:hypothetical protein
MSPLRMRMIEDMKLAGGMLASFRPLIKARTTTCCRL